MIRELFINGCILIASISMGSQIFKETGRTIATSLKAKILEGMAAGVLGCVLLFFSIYYDNKLVVDFRSIAVILSAVYGGIVSSSIASIMICFVRVLWFGLNTSSVIAVINILSIGIFSGLISHMDIIRWKKWTLFILSSVFINIITFYLIVQNNEVFYEIIPVFILGTVVLALFLYHYTRYLESFNIYNEKLKEEATVDFLTGLNNVRQFDYILNVIKKDGIEKSNTFSLLYLDIDFFKKVNDKYGHTDGDAILEQLGKLLKLSCRNFDLIFRIGGEEFSVLLLHTQSLLAQEIAERIRDSVEKHAFILNNGSTVNVTISIGVATCIGKVDDLVGIKAMADAALYQAKTSGRNKVCVAKQVLNSSEIEQR